MEKQKKYKNRKKSTVLLLAILGLFLLVLCGVGLFFIVLDKPEEELTVVDDNRVENGIHIRTGLIAAEGLETVITNCTTCHSSKLVIQNRMGVAQWNATIRWMQKTQGLWELGENQKIIVDYLVTNYPPVEKGRRAALTNIDWYPLKD